jgi:hypothetical protein
MQYWNCVSKYYDRVTLKQAKDYKGLVLEQLQALLLDCEKTTEEGTVRDVNQTRLVIKDIRDLLGLDAPAKSQVTNTVDAELSLKPLLQSILTDPNKVLGELEEAGKVLEAEPEGILNEPD